MKREFLRYYKLALPNGTNPEYLIFIIANFTAGWCLGGGVMDEDVEAVRHPDFEPDDSWKWWLQ